MADETGEKSSLQQMLSKTARRLEALDSDTEMSFEERTLLKAFYVQHFAPREVRDLFEKHFPEVLEPLKRKPRIWIHPDDPLLPPRAKKNVEEFLKES